jgi:hypothetical protein
MLQVAFFNAWKGAIDDKLIDIVTGNGGYSHCELVIGNNKTIASHYIDNAVITCEYQNLLSNALWNVLELEVKGSELNKIKAYAETQLGIEYDTKGVVCTALRGEALCVNNKKVWCSKLVARALKSSKIFSDININCMPNELYNYLTDKGFLSVSSLASSVPTNALDRYGRIAKRGKIT